MITLSPAFFKASNPPLALATFLKPISKRVFVARALAQDAQIYLMDEPLNGVDAITEETILSILENLRKEGKTIVMVHHDLQTVDKYFDWVVMVNRNLIATGPIKEVFTKANLDRTYQEKQRMSL